MEREVGGGIGMGNTCKPMSMGLCQCMTKFTTNKKKSKKKKNKLIIQKTKIMATSPITSWSIDGEKMETVADFSFLSSKITLQGMQFRSLIGDIKTPPCCRATKPACHS